DQLADHDASVRADALLVLGTNDSGIDPTSQLDAIVEKVGTLALRDPDALVRRRASQLLALGDVEEHRDLLRQLVNDPDQGVRANAWIGLARSGDEHARQQLLALAHIPGVAREL